MTKISRRDFVRRALELSAAGLLVPPALRTMGILGGGKALASALTDRDAPLGGRILIWVNLSGGNDGLNTVIPYTDPLYPQLRPNIAVPPDQVIPLNGSTGLHPAMAAFGALYQAGSLAVLQGVGYPEMNLSHFRGTDIWFSGSSSGQILETGWLARFIEAVFPDFPNVIPASPYGLQQSDSHRLPLQGNRALTGVIVDDPSTFSYLVNENYPGSWTDPVPPTHGGDELTYLRDLDRQTFAYASAIQAASDVGHNSVTYPDTNVGRQLEIVARLISGGLETPVFLASEYGFDTHAGQAYAHPDILGSVANSVAALWADLGNQGLADRVLIMTTSEFGRRVEENGSEGTDHGTAAPHFVVGSGVNGGVYGSNPNLSDLDGNGNLLIQNDYRSYFGTVLAGHFGATGSVLESVFGGSFSNLGFLTAPANTGHDAGRSVDLLRSPSPNPFRTGQRVGIDFELARAGHAALVLFDAQGRRIATLVDETRAAGAHHIVWNGQGLPAGTYLLRLETPARKLHAKLVALD
jgi:uncharacterized protein (DUF1501 family)